MVGHLDLSCRDGAAQDAILEIHNHARSYALQQYRISCATAS